MLLKSDENVLFKAQPTPRRAVVGKTGVLPDRDPPDSAWGGTARLASAGCLWGPRSRLAAARTWTGLQGAAVAVVVVPRRPPSSLGQWGPWAWTRHDRSAP